jgi:hypothetical protein
MNHLVLLGDSIFDNAAYVNGGPDVIKHLRSILPRDWQATLLAVDGSVTTDVIDQIAHIPRPRLVWSSVLGEMMVFRERTFSSVKHVQSVMRWINWQHHNDRFIALMDRHLPHWRLHRQDLNSAPLAHDTWAY